MNDETMIQRAAVGLTVMLGFTSDMHYTADVTNFLDDFMLAYTCVAHCKTTSLQTDRLS